MIGISNYAIIQGSHVRTVEQIASFCTKEAQERMRKIGLSRIPTDDKKFLSDMIASAYCQFREKPDCVLIAHSLPFIRKNGEEISLLNNTVTFYISGLPCAIMHKAVEAGCKLIEGSFYHSVMVIGADKAYSSQERVFFNTIMGDAVVAILLRACLVSFQK